MPITLNCSCGKTLRVADEHAGKRVKCPSCNAIIASTPPAPQFEVVEDEPKKAATAARPVAKPVAKPHENDDDDTDSYGLTAAEDVGRAAKADISQARIQRTTTIVGEASRHTRAAEQRPADAERGRHTGGGVDYVESDYIWKQREARGVNYLSSASALPSAG